MILSERQEKFVEFVSRENKKPIDVNDAAQMFRTVVLNLFQMYLIADKETDKMQSAWLIYSIKDEYKKNIKLWHLIDLDEFNRLLVEKSKLKRKITLLSQKRRHEKRDDFALTDSQWEETLQYFECKCAYCGEEKKLTYDHFHPFSKGGDFGYGNVIPCCTSCNSSKNNKLFNEWYPKQDFYNKQQETYIMSFVTSNKQIALF
jgi:endonuclease I